MNRSWYIIANPRAGNGGFRRYWPRLQRMIAEALPVGEFELTAGRGDASSLARRAVEQGYRHIIAVGGDGTNHEVANGILQQQLIPATEITQALLPIGTGNDWIKSYGLPRQPEAMLQVIQAGKTQLQDVGHIRYQTDDGPAERYFVNVAGMAYDGYVTRRAEQYGNGGRLFYLYLVARCLVEYNLQEAVVRANGKDYRDRFYTINFGIGRYSGGGMQLVPHARTDQGTFAVTLAGELSKASVLLNTYRFYNGTVGQHPKVKTFTAMQAEVEAGPGSSPTLLEADGEYLGYTPAAFRILPAALRVIVP